MNKKSQVFRIGVDARFFGPRQKGLGRYVQKLIQELENCELRIANCEFVIFLRQENWDEYQPARHASQLARPPSASPQANAGRAGVAGRAQNSNFKKVLADYKWYGLKEQIFLPWKIWQEKIDLMHFPHFNLPIFCPTKFIVTIHDLVLKKFPTRRASTLGPIFYWLKNLAYRLVIWLAIKRAKKIIAVSNYTKEDILKYFNVESEKIKVIYEGAPLRTHSRGQSPLVRPFKGRTKGDCPLECVLSKPYLLYVGNAYPHKNLERLILAFQKLVEKDKLNLQLVLVGEMDYFYRRLSQGLSLEAPPRIFLVKSIIFTDFVSDEQLETLYQNASLYVFPSLCEGFGLPPLEAMAHGLPVVCSQATSLPEILGPAAVYFNPCDINDITEKISSVLKNKSLQQDLIAKGFEQIKKYNWSKMAKETLETYQSVI